ncbi:anhydro-N-acetylmuramic acid kinase [Brevibacterium aurantiacum]|uniref:Anhydro-N-acetylmuramic acid kinase n=1 Tax=Brevibacterium aurantiacum TaxID=273384 RepID=A0A556CQC7_BREAU|nr:anhydro-N-acetylmuramic acid kinase [Brevibacterium aurantiacum]TSI19625.1 anhydro-N-acetylmuramic acid kinase [Brevibacterium aurantiacum]
MIIAGLMTGTSADALDVLLAEFAYDPQSTEADLRVRILASQELEFDRELRADILRLLEPRDVPLSLVSSVDARLGRFSAEALQQVCAEAGVDCDLVVSHGQTVRHDITDGAVTSTLQIGQPAWIAEATGSPVLSDVRARDVAAGGQGAPLVGILDGLLAGDVETPTAVLNLGGIANITVLAPESDPLAFDTGPANALIDILAGRISGGEDTFDRDGTLAARGRVDEELLTELLADPYYRLPAPKSTGKELFHTDYLDGFLATRAHLGEHDAIATVTQLTARTVAEACRGHGITRVIASGGGTRNPTLMHRLRAELGDDVTLTSTDEEFGLPEGGKEALLMALLGWLTWNGLAGTEPSLTGAGRPSIAGRLSPGKSSLRLPEPLHRRPTRLRILH